MKSYTQTWSLSNSSTNFLPLFIPIFFIISLLIVAEFFRGPIIDNWNNAAYALYFSSPCFLFIFIPFALVLSILTKRFLGEQYFIPIMLCISWGFYASWGIKFVPILIGSIIFNFAIRQLLCSNHPALKEKKKLILIICVTINLISLAFFKYANFFITSINQLTNLQFYVPHIALPFGISFFTFQEIILAVDTYRGAYKGGFLKYILFVSFFPHLVAGPLVHHREMMPQFSKFRITSYNLFLGFGLISIGLFKKVVIADSLSPFVKLVFDDGYGQSVTMLSAWSGALAYAFQIYFDFSGYSDMALGLARLFGVRLPINFNSPYKSQNIIEFWRRWHITLSRFLREYLYFPLGGNRHGSLRRYSNLMIVMLLGGLWHGANWTFVIWGGMHGSFLIINHGYNKLKETFPRIIPTLPSFLSKIFTFICVVIAWVPFRAKDYQHIKALWLGMFGYNGLGWSWQTFSFKNIIMMLDQLTVPNASKPGIFLLLSFLLYLFCLITPAAHQLMPLNQIVPGYKSLAPKPLFLRWHVSFKWSIFMGLLFGTAVLLGRQSISEFLYWSF